jgi:hypothetical protein
VPAETALVPQAVLATPLPTLRAAGLSERKASYLVDLAARFQDGRLSDELLTSEWWLRSSVCEHTRVCGCVGVRPRQWNGHTRHQGR